MYRAALWQFVANIKYCNTVMKIIESKNNLVIVKKKSLYIKENSVFHVQCPVTAHIKHICFLNRPFRAVAWIPNPSSHIRRYILVSYSRNHVLRFIFFLTGSFNIVIFDKAYRWKVYYKIFPKTFHFMTSIFKCNPNKI